jgi:hypothetical protein
MLEEWMKFLRSAETVALAAVHLATATRNGVVVSARSSMFPASQGANNCHVLSVSEFNGQKRKKCSWEFRQIIRLFVSKGEKKSPQLP